MSTTSNHLLLAGGGLANCLIALRMAETHPDLRITVFEAGPELCGNHTWSFHADDLNRAQHAFIQPIVQHHWTAQEVRFPGFTRPLPAGYFSITSDALRAQMERSHITIRTRTAVTTVDSNRIELDDGEHCEGSAVLDGRGQARADGLVLGFQKFFGREVQTEQPHGIEQPVIMDATVSQADGYRFIYLLPFDDTTLLIEDTRYSDGNELNDQQLSGAIDDYAAEHGWTIRNTLREERGILPILMAGRFDQFWPEHESVARSGLRAALFHPTTGYSLPQAMTLADAIVRHWPMDGEQLAKFTRQHALDFWNRTGFFRLLNRMLFRCGMPEKRYTVMARFYTLSDSLIENFYASDLTWLNKARLVVGKPPVPFFEGLSMIGEQKFLRREAQRSRQK
ncbi:MAG: lycopene beta-cyclase CrtY [Pseudomonadota bacterium]